MPSTATHTSAVLLAMSFTRATMSASDCRRSVTSTMFHFIRWLRSSLAVSYVGEKPCLYVPRMNETPMLARFPIHALRYLYTEWSCSGIAQTPNDSSAACDDFGVTCGSVAALAAGVSGDAQPLKTGAAAPAAAATAPRLRTWRRECMGDWGRVLR